MPENKIVDMDEHRPHEVAELICIMCRHRWIGVYPADTPLKALHCPSCRAYGAVIKTGQTINGS